MAEDFRSTLAKSYELTDAFPGVCTLCTRGDQTQKLEIYQHRDIPQIFALFCPRCGGLFQVDLGRASGAG